MKKLKEFIKNRKLEEAYSVSSDKVDQLEKLNKGREGKPLINLKGEEVKDSMWLGGGKLIHNNKGTYIVVEYDILGGEKTEMWFSKKQFNLLKKMR